MKRRSFLAALFAAPMVPAVAKAMGQPHEPAPLPDVPLYDPRQHTMVFEDGVLKLQSANIHQVTAGVIRTRDSNMVIDLANGCMTFKT